MWLNTYQEFFSSEILHLLLYLSIDIISWLNYLNIQYTANKLPRGHNFLTIIENNYFEDYSKSDIKHVAIENNKLAITLFKSDKVFNFPIEDFKENELKVNVYTYNNDEQ